MPDRASRLSRPALPGWGLALFLSLLLAGLSLVNGLGRFDYLIYDNLLRTIEHDASPDIVLIAIDDGSLEKLGNWPWPRTTHAQLLDQLPEARAIAFDIIFSEVDRYGGQEDAQLAAAIRRHGQVVLPGILDVASGNIQPPTPKLAQAAAGIGYINMQPDTDGVARRFMPLSVNHAPHMADVMLSVAGLPVKRPIAPGQSALLRYAGPSGQYIMLPYADVLQGRIDPAFWKDKLIIVGAWATGLGDNFATPMARTGMDMAGMEILANIIQSRQMGLEIRVWPVWGIFLIWLIPVLLLYFALRHLSPRHGLYAVGLALVATLLGSWLLLRYGQIWVPPGAALVILTISYPLWSWRSQELALRSLDSTLATLRQEDQNFPEIPQRQRRASQHILDTRIHELGLALERVRNLRAFISNSLESTPDPTWVCNPDGTLRYFNRAAARYWKQLSTQLPLSLGMAILPLLQTAFPRLPAERLENWLAGRDTDTGNLADSTPQAADHTLESQDSAGIDWLLQHAWLQTPERETAGIVITMTDISIIRTIERRREQSLSFLSHDMRAPQNSILAQIELREQESPGAAEVQTLKRITNYARQTLELVDGFVQLTRAESAQLHPYDTDLYDLLCECCDNFFSLAQTSQLRIHTGPPPEEPATWLSVDATMLRRAIGNLLHNAIKFSPAYSSIECNLLWEAEANRWVITIRDHGPGVPPEDLQTLFEAFTQNATGTAIRNPGAGLGLAFVLTVAQRHHGTAWASNAPDGGAIFHIALPAVALAEDTEIRPDA
ncbi:CHASE2 domain-containing protein [Kerstersia similis]|uniref:CHASE2 domain-containing protein n=1 Tax=Kerstersia similis TaxID=206505 RepID=UPI0039F0F8E6